MEWPIAGVAPVYTRYAGKIIKTHWLALSLLLCGPFYYFLGANWFDIRHPAWIVWAWVALTSMTLVLNRRRMFVFRATATDYLLAAFVVVVFVSTVAWNRDRIFDALRLLSTYLLLPYAATRFLHRNEIHRFIVACAVLGLAAIPLALIEIDTLSVADLSLDRIPSFFGAYYTLNDTGLLLGSYLVMAVAFLFAQQQWALTIPRFVLWASLLICVTVMTVLGVRGGLAAALAICAVAPFFSWPSSVAARVLVLAAIALSVVVSFSLMPGARKSYFQQVLVAGDQHDDGAVDPAARDRDTPAYTPGPQVSARAPDQRASGDKHEKNRPAGNSVSVRTHLIDDALAAFRGNPAVGIGASGFGDYSPTQRALARNSICYEKANDGAGGWRSYRCSRSVKFSSPHSTVLHAFSELGIVGGSVFLVLILSTARAVGRVIRTTENALLRRDALVLSLLWSFYFLSDQFYGSYFTSFQFYLLTGCMIAIAANIGTSTSHGEPVPAA